MIVDTLNELTKELKVSKDKIVWAIHNVGTNKENLKEYLTHCNKEGILGDNGFQVNYTAIMMNEKDKRITELEKALELACENSYMIDNMCHCPCQQNECWEITSTGAGKCMANYFKQKSKEELKDE